VSGSATEHPGQGPTGPYNPAPHPAGCRCPQCARWRALAQRSPAGQGAALQAAHVGRTAPPDAPQLTPGQAAALEWMGFKDGRTAEAAARWLADFEAGDARHKRFKLLDLE
jgi:hypothetical protein